MKTSVYLYLVPVVTIAASVLILHEKISAVSVLGTERMLMGLVLSDKGKAAGKNN
ncbi:EamA family transporter [Blautia pseudococcoides]|uniref:EamA family transporter n=1 Tax=Blautia pseudococcoides TaxID=1796616 RepID=UPI001FABA664|nr:EamA family transporter [Blautia pseudococcoides]MCR2019005.1 DMT family transporter [Blautia pseudococcoides]